MGRKICNTPSSRISGNICCSYWIQFITICLVLSCIYWYHLLKVLGSGNKMLNSVILCAVVVYCFVFSCAYVEVLRVYTDDV